MGECAPSGTGILRTCGRLMLRETMPIHTASQRISAMILRRAAALTSLNGQIETTTSREAKARAGADLDGPTTPVPAAAPTPLMLARLVKVMTAARDWLTLARALMVRDVDRAHAAEPPASHHLKRMMGQALAAVGAIATRANLVPTRRRDAVPMGRKAQDPMVHAGVDDPAAMSAVPTDRSVAPEQRRPLGREVPRACLGTMAKQQDGAAGRDRTARNGLAAASDRAAAVTLLVLEAIRPETTNKVATDELIADRASPEGPVASAVRVPAVHGLVCRPVLEALVATVAPARSAILDSAVPAGR